MDQAISRRSAKRGRSTGWTPTRPGEPTLAEGEIHLWRFSLDRPRSTLSRCEALLSADERARAEGYGRPELRRRFVLGRGIQRIILAASLGSAHPAAIGFDYGAHGKPRLRPPYSALRFNLSHCGDEAVLALAWEIELGLDLERRRRVPKAARLAERYFGSAERAWLARSGDPGGEAFSAAFLELWCRKEAYLKATGEALSRPLVSVAVSLTDELSAASSSGRAEWVGTEQDRRAVQPITIPDHVAALVTAQPVAPRRISTWLTRD